MLSEICVSTQLKYNIRKFRQHFTRAPFSRLTSADTAAARPHMCACFAVRSSISIARLPHYYLAARCSIIVVTWGLASCIFLTAGFAHEHLPLPLRHVVRQGIST